MLGIFSFPPQILHILQIFEQADHQAFLVGGCVRDHLLGIAPVDFDICTDALPEQTMGLFDHCIPTGIAHGTVTVLYDGVQAEVTTFRKETGYSDHRHPDGVSFTTDLAADLARRDFTVNAMAMDRSGNTHDPFGGEADLRAGVLRCVGDPNRRFQEDALRMLRGLRFRAQLGFSIENATMDAIRANASQCAYVAAERVQAELLKTLLSPHPEVVGAMIQLGLLSPILPPIACPDLTTLSQLPPDKHLRYARLLYLFPDQDPEKVLRALKLDKVTIRSVSRGVAVAKAGLPQTPTELKLLMSQEDDLTVNCACACGDYHGLMEQKETILQSGDPWHLRHLAVTGKDLAHLGVKPAETGAVLRQLLDAVIHTPALNRREDLLNLARSIHGSHTSHKSPKERPYGRES